MDRDPELVIQQALRAQAGGPRRPLSERSVTRSSVTPSSVTPQPARRRWPGRFTTVQVILLAATIGLVIGMAAGFAVLLLQ